MTKHLPVITVFCCIFLILCIFTGCSTQPKDISNQPSQGDVGGKQPETEDIKMPEEALFVCLYTTNQIAVIDLAKGEVVKEISVGAKPIALAKSPDNRFVYVANSGTGDIHMINTANGKIEAKIAMGNQPVAMAVNTNGDKLYVVDYYLNRVSLIDLNLRSMVGFFELNTFGFEERIEPPDCCSDMFGDPIGAGRKPSAIVLDEEAGKIYVGNLGTWDVAVIDIAKEKEVKAFDAVYGINKMLRAGKEGNLVISAAGNELEVNDSLLMMDLKSGATKSRIKVGEKPVSMALAPDGQIIYVITQKDNKLSSVKLADGKVIGQCQLPGQPGEIVLSEDGKMAYIADLVDGAVVIVDTQTYQVIDRLAVGVTPKSLVYIH